MSDVPERREKPWRPESRGFEGPEKREKPIARNIYSLGTALNGQSDSKVPVGREYWVKDDVIQDTGALKNTLLRKGDVLKAAPFQRPPTRSGILATVFVLLAAASYGGYQVWEYFSTIQSESRMETLPPGACENVSITCHCAMGCIFTSHGNLTAEHNGRAGYLKPRMTTTNVGICAGSRIQSEAFVLASHTTLHWEDTQTEDHRNYFIVGGMKGLNGRISSRIGYLPPSALNELRYITASCEVYNLDRLRNCVVVYNTVSVPGFENSTAPETKTRKTTILPENLVSPCSQGSVLSCQIKETYQLDDDVAVLLFEGVNNGFSSLCAMDLANGSHLLELECTEFFSEYPSQTHFSFDVTSSTFTVWGGNSALFYHRFSKLSGWTVNQQPFPTSDCTRDSSSRKLGTFEGRIFLICQEEFTGTMSLEVFDGTGNLTNRIALSTPGTGLSSDGTLDVRRDLFSENGIFIFYPYSDINSDMNGACYCFSWKAETETPTTIEIPHCIGHANGMYFYQGPVTPYFLGSLEAYLYGPAVIFGDGTVSIPNAEESMRSHVCVEGSCAPYLPADFQVGRTNVLALASMPKMTAQPLGGRNVYFSVYQVFGSLGKSTVLAPCSDGATATLETFGSMSLANTSSSYITGFVEEHYSLSNEQSTRFRQVSYLGPSSEESVDKPHTLGFLHYINLYPALKIVYSERRVLSWSDIPSNAYGVFRQIFVLTGYFVPVVFLVFCACFVKGKRETPRASLTRNPLTEVTEPVTKSKETTVPDISPCLYEAERGSDPRRGTLGRDVWKEEDIIRTNGGPLQKIIVVTDLFQYKPLYRPPTRSGLLATVLVLVAVALFTVYEIREYQTTSSFTTKIETMEAGTCTKATMTCKSPVGCVYKPSGSYSIEKNPALVTMGPDETTDSIYLCPGGSNQGEAIAILGRTTLSWKIPKVSGFARLVPLYARSLTTRDASGQGPEFYLTPNATSAILMMPSNGFSNQLEYFSMACHDTAHECALLHATLGLPSFEERRLATSHKSSSNIVARFTDIRQHSCGEERCYDTDDAMANLRKCFSCNQICTLAAFRFGVDRALLQVYVHFYDAITEPCDAVKGLCLIHLVQNGSLATTFSATRDCIFRPPSELTFDSERRSLVQEYQRGRQPRVLNYVDGVGWQSRIDKNHTLSGYTDCSFIRIAVFDENYFYFCLGDERKNGSLHVIDREGNTSVKALPGIMVYGGFPPDNAHLTAVRSNTSEAEFIVFYPYPDFQSTVDPYTSCHYFVLKTIHDKPVLKVVPNCYAYDPNGASPNTYEGRLIPYYLPNNDVYSFGPALVTRTGALYNLTADENYRRVACDGFECAPLIPVDYSSLDTNKMTLAAFLGPQYQQQLYEATEVRFFVFQMDRDELNPSMKFPFQDDALATLDSFADHATLYSRERSAFSGFLEEYHLLNRSKNTPKLVYEAVSYWGPQPSVGTDFSRFGVGKVSLVNLYPSIKAVSTEQRALTISSMPARIYNAFQVVFGILGLLLPILSLVLCCCPLNNEVPSETEVVAGKVPSWGETSGKHSKSGAIDYTGEGGTRKDSSRGKQIVLGRSHWREEDMVVLGSGKLSRVGAKVDLFKAKPLARPPTRSGLCASVMILIATALYGAYEVWQYENATELSARFETIPPGYCQPATVTCEFGIGCAYFARGALTQAKNPPRISVHQGQQNTLNMCPGSSEQGELFEMITHSFLDWAVYKDSFGKQFPAPMAISTNSQLRNKVPQLVLPLPPSAELNQLEYLSIQCRFDRRPYCLLLHNTLELPGFERYQGLSPSTFLVSNFTEACMESCIHFIFNKLEFSCDIRDIYRLHSGVTVLHFFDENFPEGNGNCKYFATGASIRADTQCLTLPTYGGTECNVAFDAQRETFVYYTPEGLTTTYAFDTSSGWVVQRTGWYSFSKLCDRNEYDKESTDIGDSQMRLGVLDNNFFYFCFVEYAPEYDTHWGTGSLQVFGDKGTNSSYEIYNSKVSMPKFSWPKWNEIQRNTDKITVRWIDERNDEVIVFYPYMDFSNSNSTLSCAYLTLRGIHTMPRINIVNYCNYASSDPEYRGPVSAYYLPTSDVFVFGPVILRPSGVAFEPRTDARLVNNLQLPWVADPGFCAPFLPVDFDDEGIVTLATMTNNMTPINQEAIQSNTIQVLIYQLRYNSGEPPLVILPGDGKDTKLVSLDSFNNHVIFGSSHTVISGFVEEYYLLNRTNDDPDIRYRPVPFSGLLDVNENTFANLTTGNVSYVNMYSSLRAIYKEERVLSPSSIPASIYGTYRLLLVSFGFVVPLVYFSITPSRCKRQFEEGDDSSHDDGDVEMTELDSVKPLRLRITTTD
eukprot:gb/GECG01014902.1/.p1 GENE.gb/GECG01014902.1/~~gb/GECG01014902.1/.p1  ORF type:complete len:2334 (+),score=154.34 gb/GECG01014902.1/:1-7002(+)